MLSYSELGLGLVVSTSVRYSHAKGSRSGLAARAVRGPPVVRVVPTCTNSTTAGAV